MLLSYDIRRTPKSFVATVWQVSFHGALIGLALCLSVAVTWAEGNIQVNLTANKLQARVNDEIELRISVQGDFQSVQRPKLPPNESFRSFYVQQSSKFFYSEKLKNYERYVEFVYTIIPIQAGKRRFGPLEISVGKGTYTATALEFEIAPDPMGLDRTPVPVGLAAQSGPAIAPPASQNSSPASSRATSADDSNVSRFIKGADQDIFLKVWADRMRVYPGEQVTVTYSLFTRLDTRFEGFDQEANTKGFWQEDLGQGTAPEQKVVYVGGKRYIQADIKKMALFPTSPGDYRIEPGTVKCTVEEAANQPQSDYYFGSFFEDRFFTKSLVARREARLLGAEELPITVLPFPEKNKPLKFNNLSGIFEITAAVDKQQVKVNEPVHVEVTVQGKGNIELVERPEFPALDSFRVVEAESTSKVLKIKDMITGWKKFSYVFIPRKEGEYTAGPFRLTYFDPIKEAFAVAESKAYRISVMPGEVAATETSFITAEASRPQSLQEPTATEAEEFPLMLTGAQTAAINRTRSLLKILAGVNGLMVALWLALVIFEQKKRRQLADMPRYRARRAWTVFAKELGRVKASRAHGKTEKLHQLYSEVSRIGLNYFADKFDQTGTSLTYQQVAVYLKEGNLEGAEANRVIELLQACDYARFASIGISQENLRQTLQELMRLIQKFEKQSKPNDQTRQ